MHRKMHMTRRVTGWFVGATLSAWAAAHAADVDRSKELFDNGEYDKAVALLVAEAEENPANERARVLLARAYEKAGRFDEAMAAWSDLKTLTRHDGNLRTAQCALNRLRRQRLDRLDVEDPQRTKHGPDPFKIPMPEIDWEGLEVIEDSSYLPALPVHPFEVPPFVYPTQHFTVYTANERFSKVVGDRAEIYLKFMLERLFGGRSWAVRFPIIVYTTSAEYVSHGAPAGSGGVTFGHITGKTGKLLFFQLRNSTGKSGGSGQGIWKYGLESVLPHELTHAVINEFFGGQETPRWLHEAVAGRFEQTREHYVEAARLARSVVAGEYFRLRDLFEQKRYPERVALFYEQSAIIVLYLFETGPDAMHAFMRELAAGNDHDAACAAALGIPEEGAVEEFEKRWVEWMKLRYLHDLDIDVDDTQVATAERSDHSIFLPWVNELDTVKNIETWRDVKLDALDGFLGAGSVKKDWSTSGGTLRCDLSGASGASILGIRMNEIAPVVLTCDVRYLGAPGDEQAWFGFTQLAVDGYDTRAKVLTPMTDGKSHKIVCLWTNDLVLYNNGDCTGRYPAYVIGGNEQDVDFPLAFVAHGPVEIENIRIAAIKKFSDEPVLAAAAEEEKSDQPEQRKRRTRRGGSDRRPRRGGGGPGG